MAKLIQDEIIDAVMAKIEHCDSVAHDYRDAWAIEEIRRSYHRAGIPVPRDVPNHQFRQKRFAAAADRLRDFAQVELFLRELNITREEI